MPAPLRLYDFPTSPFCAKVRAALCWQQVAFESIDATSPAAWWRLQRSSAATVPALEVDGRLLADATAICLALHARHPGRPLLPPDPREQALCLALNGWCESALYRLALHMIWLDPSCATSVRRRFPAGPLGLLMFHGYRARISRQQQVLGLSRYSEAQRLESLERVLETAQNVLAEQAFLMGDQPWLCDLALFGQLRFLGYAPRGATALARRPALRNYVARVKASVGWQTGMRGRLSAG